MAVLLTLFTDTYRLYKFYLRESYTGILYLLNFVETHLTD